MIFNSKLNALIIAIMAFAANHSLGSSVPHHRVRGSNNMDPSGVGSIFSGLSSAPFSEALNQQHDSSPIAATGDSCETFLANGMKDTMSTQCLHDILQNTCDTSTASDLWLIKNKVHKMVEFSRNLADIVLIYPDPHPVGIESLHFVTDEQAQPLVSYLTHLSPMVKHESVQRSKWGTDEVFTFTCSAVGLESVANKYDFTVNLKIQTSK